VPLRGGGPRWAGEARARSRVFGIPREERGKSTIEPQTIGSRGAHTGTEGDKSQSATTVTAQGGVAATMRGTGRRLDLSRADTLLLLIFLQCPGSESFHTGPALNEWGCRLRSASVSSMQRCGMDYPLLGPLLFVHLFFLAYVREPRADLALILLV